MSGVVKLLVGPIGSGKSTFCRDAAVNHYRVSQDEQGRKGHWDSYLAALERKEPHIIIDRMNFSRKQRKRYIEVAKYHGYKVTVTEFRGTPDSILIDRVAKRKNHPTISEDDYVTARAVLTFFRLNYEPVDKDLENIDFYTEFTFA